MISWSKDELRKIAEADDLHMGTENFGRAAVLDSLPKKIRRCLA